MDLNKVRAYQNVRFCLELMISTLIVSALLFVTKGILISSGSFLSKLFGWLGNFFLSISILSTIILFILVFERKARTKGNENYVKLPNRMTRERTRTDISTQPLIPHSNESSRKTPFTGRTINPDLRSKLFKTNYHLIHKQNKRYKKAAEKEDMGSKNQTSTQIPPRENINHVPCSQKVNAYVANSFPVSVDIEKECVPQTENNRVQQSNTISKINFNTHLKYVFCMNIEEIARVCKSLKVLFKRDHSLPNIKITYKEITEVI